MPNCLDCGILLKDTRSKRCRKCNAKIAPTVFKQGQTSPRKGTKHTLEAIEKNRQKHLGKRQTIEHRLKTSESMKKIVASGKHNFWKGGIDKAKHAERYALMKTVEYKLWRDAVFQRDNYTCQMCADRQIYLEADHIKPWALYPELRFAIDNGRTLCKSCHKLKTKMDWQQHNLRAVKEVS